jgi:hypothetical protein
MISPGRGSKITPDTPLEIVFRVKYCAEAPEFEGPLYGDDLKGITFSSRGSNASRAFLSGTEEELLYAPGLRVYPGQTQEFSKKYVATIKTRPDYYMVYFYKGTDPGRFLWEPPVQGTPPLEGVRFVFPLGWTY